MSTDNYLPFMEDNGFLVWCGDWISDWFGLFDIAIGIITLTFYYPQTQEWFFRKIGRWN